MTAFVVLALLVSLAALVAGGAHIALDWARDHVGVAARSALDPADQRMRGER